MYCFLNSFDSQIMIDEGPTLYLVPYSLYSAFTATSDTRFYRNNK